MVLIAPGARHMQLRRSGGQYQAAVQDGPPFNRHTPSVDVLLRSAAECAGEDVLAIILTGTGDDGARGMRALHEGGAGTIARARASCVVFGMPKEAIKLGAVDEVLPLDRVADAILRFDARSERPDGRTEQVRPRPGGRVRRATDRRGFRSVGD